MNMKTLLKYTLFCMALGLAVSGPAQAQRAEVMEAVKLLKMEVRRDKNIVENPMNITNLKKTRATLSAGFRKKEKLLADLKKHMPAAAKKAVEIIEETLIDEKKIAQSPRITHRHRKGAYYTIKENIAKKEQALNIFNGWLGG